MFLFFSKIDETKEAPQSEDFRELGWKYNKKVISFRFLIFFRFSYGCVVKANKDLSFHVS